MSKEKQPVYLIIAAFNDIDRAEEVLNEISERDKHIPSVVILIKDEDGNVRFKDVGKTPRKEAVKGVVLGGVIGVLTGGTGLVLGALGGLAGHRHTKQKQAESVASLQLKQVAGSLGPDSSAIVGVSDKPLKESVDKELKEKGAFLYQATIPADMIDHLEDYSDENYETLLASLAEETGGEAKMEVPYRRIYVVINPASGKPQPVLHILNKAFHRYGVQWDLGLTHKYGDATEFARKAAESGDYDLVVGFGGDGTQHEIANGVIGTGVTMGVLPGGTGNGFATELGVPNKLEPAVEVLCTSYNVRKIDIAQYDEDAYFIQRLFTGIEPEEQTSREDKDKYGTFAYLMRDVNRYKAGEMQDIPYRLTVDGEVTEIQGYKCYVVNSGMAGTGLTISKEFKIDDGYLDVFMLSSDKTSTSAAIDRFFGLSSDKASMYYWRGQEITIDAESDQPVWTDGEYTGRTPVPIKVLPKALTVAVP